MKAKLTLYVTYAGEDANEDLVQALLQNLVEHAADNGLLTGDFNLTVEESTFEISTKED